MRNIGCSRWGLWGGLFVIALLCILGVALFYFQARAQAFNSRPLVLIHSPINHDLVSTGDGILVHATAREDNGLRRIELWVDDQLIDAHDAPEAATNLTLSSNWMPDQAGPHVVVVRATSVSGVEGQATVTVQASEAATAATHIVQEGETAESIAVDYGVSLNDLAASNPDLGSAAAGDELIIPEGGSAPGEASGDVAAPPGEEEPPAGAAPPPDESGEPPFEAGEPPGSFSLFREVFEYFLPQGEPTPITLRVEITGLQTSESFDGLHCYVGLAEGSPQWFPDADGDQTTDESFEALDDGRWDVEPYLAGDAALVLVWPDNQALPLNVSCVGIAGGGTDALEFGQLGVDILPEHWDGITRSIWAEGAAGRIQVDYLARRGDTSPHGIPIFDPLMTRPTNVRLDESASALRWDYNPRPDAPEDDITGFAIYLNDNLQWLEESPSARLTRLPPEWFHPPCGSTYRFSVTAFRGVRSDDTESFPSDDASVATPAEGCGREVMVTFTRLETFNLGSDGHHEDRSGDVGPPYGQFYANDAYVEFDTGCISSCPAGLDRATGISHNSNYDLMSLAEAWNFTSAPSLTLDMPDGGALQFGFYIRDEDSGWCHDGNGPGCDDMICEATSAIYTDPGEFDRGYEGALTSENGRCVVYFTFGPAPGSPVGSGVEGGEPLPWIDVEDILFDTNTGAVQVLIKNTGYAAWPWKELDVELRTREGDTITRITHEDFFLERGERETIPFPEGTLDRPYDACVIIDPEDKVLEHFERSGALVHSRVCLPLPDLVFSDVQYSDGTIHTVVENVGEGALVNRPVYVEAFLRSRDLPPVLNAVLNVTLEPGDSLPIQLDGIDEAFREAMRGGYSVWLDPVRKVPESNRNNNIYDVRPADRIWISWQSVTFPTRYDDDTSFEFYARAVSGDTRRQLAHWSLPREIDWNVSYAGECSRQHMDSQFSTGWLDIYGDETLEISIQPAAGQLVVGNGVETYSSSDDWGGGPPYNGGTGGELLCGSLEMGMPGRHNFTFSNFGGYAWESSFNICVESLSE